MERRGHVYREPLSRLLSYIVAGVVTMHKFNDMESVKQKREALKKEFDDSLSKYHKITQAGLAEWVKNFQEGKVKLDKVDDLEKLIQIDIMLQNYKRVVGGGGDVDGAN